MTPAVGAYLVYLALSLGVTVCVGRTLHRHGRPFLVEVFAGRTWLADATNHVLLTGFYLTNSALVLMFLTVRRPPASWDAALVSLAFQVGVVLMTLGAMHFANVASLLGVRRWLGRNGGERVANRE
ncbi:hypothetical protein [Planctellipticum variicoloris]|uniref:hypothetical protein n=1 Tax=Planctellipticum variicoloris TaxID=3064265 RepID=UPI0030134DB1|nr:hypothetical protein SH412_001562 [Planctomycetaceae bacterium SH412]